MSDSMTVVHVTPGLGLGGAERLLVDLCAEPTHGIHHHVVSLGRGNELEAELLAGGVPVVTVPMSFSVASFLRLLSLRRHIKEQNPHIIQSWNYHTALLCLIVCPDFKRTIWSIHHTPTDRDGMKTHTRRIVNLLRVFSRYPRKIIYASQASREAHERLGYNPHKGLVIANAVKDRSVVGLRSSARRSDSSGQPGMICVAGYRPVKNHAGLIRGLEIARRGVVRPGVTLVGPGLDAKNAELVDLIRSAGVEDCVKLMGPSSDIYSILPQYELIIVPSLSESLPLSLLEGINAGLLPIVTPVGGCPALVGTEGIVAKSSSPEHIAEAIQVAFKMEKSERECRVSALRERMRNEHGWPACHRAYQGAWVGDRVP